jgi:curved DNA-binding protein CbpA
MLELEDYYKILGIPNNSSASQIRKRYQQLAKRHHPDHQGDENSMVIINGAYEVLSNSAKRIEYDHLRRVGQKVRTTASSSRQGTQANWSKASKAKAKDQDLKKVIVFIILILLIILGFH